MKEAVREFSGRIRGWREDEGNKIVARAFSGMILGYYDKDRDVTTDFYGSIYCTGDGTVGLIMSAEEQKIK